MKTSIQDLKTRFGRSVFTISEGIALVGRPVNLVASAFPFAHLEHGLVHTRIKGDTVTLVLDVIDSKEDGYEV